MRVRVYKKEGGNFTVLLLNRGKASYQVRLLPPMSRPELKTALPQAISEMLEADLEQLKMSLPVTP